MGLFGNQGDPPTPFMTPRAEGSYLGALEEQYRVNKQAEIDIERSVASKPASGAIEYPEIDPILAVTSAGASVYGGMYAKTASGVANALLDEVTMGGSSLVKGAKSLLSNTHKINPYRYKPTEGSYFRGIGRTGADDAINSGVIRTPKDSFYKDDVFVSNNFSTVKNYSRDKDTYGGDPFDDAIGWHKIPPKDNKNYIVEIPEDKIGNISKRGQNIASTTTKVQTKDTKILKEDWLMGYKQINELKNISGEELLELKGKVGDVDDLMKLSSDEIESLTDLDKIFWESIISKHGQEKANKFLGRKLHSAGKVQLEDAPKYIDSDGIIETVKNTSKKRQQDWLNSDEWLTRRIKATGETTKEAKMARGTMLHRLKTSEVELKNTTGLITDKYGFAYTPKEGVSQVTLAVDKTNKKALEGNLNHEIIHASNAWNTDYTMKGINFQKILPESENAGVINTVNYLNKKPEMQVRGVRALAELKNKGLWNSGDVSDKAIDYLKMNTHDLPNDVTNIVVNLDKTKLKKFLNSVYSVSSIATGTGLYNQSQK